MITAEDYVSFETAKLLKEKGFENVCHAVYDKDGIFINLLQFVGNSNFKGVNEEKISFAPTLQMAMKWLRKVHNIHIEVRITNHSLSSLINVPRYYWIIFNAKEVKWMDESTAHKPMSYETVEEACEAAIKYCLENLI